LIDNFWLVSKILLIKELNSLKITKFF
ncbi:hypothetical protein TNCT_16241, partial [Trichonephila clavata]